MNLKTLFWLAALFYAFVIGGSLLLYRLYIVFPAIEEATIDARMHNIKVMSASYLHERESLMNLNRDWARWNDTFEFVENLNLAYIIENIKGNNFDEFNIDAFAIINMKGETLYAINKENNVFTEIKQVQEISVDLDINHIINKNGQYGIIRVQNKYGIYVSHHIQDSRQLHTPNGVLIYMRLLKSEFFNRIKLISNVSVKIEAPNNTTGTSYPHFDDFNITDIKDHYFFNFTNTRGDIIGQSKVTFPIDSSPKAFDSHTLVSILVLLTLPLFLSGLTNFLILKPGIEISDKIHLMKSSGNVFHLTQQSYIKEVDDFLKTFNSLVDEINVYQQKLVNDSNTDGLTGIYNRKYFDLEYDKSWRVSTRSGGPLSIIMMDIDFFKKYNDHYGHLQGDIALKEVAATLSHVTRRAEDTLARYGGEEFVMISHAKNKQQLEDILSIILKSVTKLNIEHKKSSALNILTISCGACFIENNKAVMKDLKLRALNTADEALYEAKENGRNQFIIRIFDGSDNPSSTS